MPLPKRPAPYILALLLMLLAVLVAWMFQTLTTPKLNELAKAKRPPAPARPPEPSAPLPLPRTVSTPPSAPVVIDPMHQEKADRLHAADMPPHQDLEIVSEFLQVYSKALGGNPIGDNADITAALTGAGGHKGRVFPPTHRTIKNGQLVDRWGTPYWFHPNSGSQMEIRSAGPDKQLFTDDDIVQNPSPAGLGATPQAADSTADR